jgi:hypothetical protein
MRLNVDEIVVIGPKNAIFMRASPEGDHIPYIEVRNGLMAKCARAVAYDLYEIAIEESETDDIGLWSVGFYFNLSSS